MQNKNSFNIFDYLSEYFDNEIHKSITQSDFLESSYALINYKTDNSMEITPSFNYLMGNVFNEIYDGLQKNLEEVDELYATLNNSISSLIVEYYSFDGGGGVVQYIIRYNYYENGIKQKMDINLIYRAYSNSFYYGKSIQAEKQIIGDLFESKAFADILIHQTEILRMRGKYKLKNLYDYFTYGTHQIEKISPKCKTKEI